jgi:hypothetical protein
MMREVLGILRISGWGAALVAGLLAVAAGPAAAQTPPARPASATPGDVSIPGNARPDTLVVSPKNGETVTFRLPKQGLLFINSLTPWAVTATKENAGVEVHFDVRGISIQHIAPDIPARLSFTLRLIDGRTITVNVRSINTKYKTGYAIIA